MNLAPIVGGVRGALIFGSTVAAIDQLAPSLPSELRPVLFIFVAIFGWLAGTVDFPVNRT